MRILVAAVPAAGHFNPLTGPAVRLKELGHEICWYAGPAYAPKIERLGLDVLPYRHAVEVTADNLNALFPQRQKLRGPKLIEFDADTMFARPIQGQFHDIRDAHGERPFDALLTEGAFYASYLVAKRLDIPVFMLGSIAAPTFRGRNATTPFFGLRPPRTPIGQAINSVTRAMVLSSSRKGADTVNRYLAEEGLPPIPTEEYFDCTQEPDVARRVFNVGLPELDFPKAYTPPNTEWVGALPPHSSRSTEMIDQRIVECSGKVVIVSQGTVDNHDPSKLMIPTIAAFAGSDRLLVVATGGVGTAELRSKYASANVLIDDYVDFDQAFSHTELFVTNGGLGGVLQALSHGVPLLVAGMREGKGDINARLAFRGLALDLRSETPSARKIARGVRRVLRDAEMRSRVAATARALAAYDSVDIITRTMLDDLCKSASSRNAAKAGTSTSEPRG